MENFLYMKLETGTGISNVQTRLKDSDLELPYDEFFERYVRPAYMQLIAEQKALLDSAAPVAPDPD
jgi:thiaminase